MRAVIRAVAAALGVLIGVAPAVVVEYEPPVKTLFEPLTFSDD